MHVQNSTHDNNNSFSSKNNKRPSPRGGVYSKIWKYENPFVKTDEDITEAALQFTLIEEDDIDINV